MPGRVIVWPWESIYTVDTSKKDVFWGENSGVSSPDIIYSRASDGNEVALSVTVRYQVDGQKLPLLVQSVAKSDREINGLVAIIARADIRRSMNELSTAHFARTEQRYAKAEEVRSRMNARLKKYGILITDVILNAFQFERLLKDGAVDDSYQERITQIQKLEQDTEALGLKIETVKAQKEQELHKAEGEAKRVVEESKGYEKQARSRGDSYFKAKSNDAAAILSKGQAEVQGIIEQINSLAGPGGKAILKLEVAKELQKHNPKFVLMKQGTGDGKGLEVSRIDTNTLLDQIGIFESLVQDKKGAIQAGQGTIIEGEKR